MKLKKISILILLLIFLIPNFSKADDTFLDNNAVTNFSDVNAHLVVSELNTGKIISKRGENKKVSVGKLPNYLALYLLADNLKNNKITLETQLTIASNDEILSKYKYESSITVKDAIFLLENENSNSLNQTVFNHFNVNLEKAKDILGAMSLHDTQLESLDNSEKNTSTAKNISFLTSLILKSYPKITEITKNPEFTLSTGELIKNTVEFKESDKFRVLGLDYSDKNSITYAYSGNTKLIITVLNQNDDKTSYFEKLQKTYDYLFTNYNYKLALKAGTYTINSERITFENDIYDLFYEKHSIRDVTYLLMNKKILLFQKYETISANEGTVFADFKSNDSAGKLAKVKATFINDDNFNNKGNLEKTTIIIDRTKFFATGVLAIYTLVFAALYVMKQAIRKD
ncbi:hypothetical protein [uncultured Gemella sp.]|uniref:hypothetical protein n=1 Tax=uncultured Gemella sp. TaxID=254352 RepID=UPI0028D61F4F|nr:hypothetical protein [uncultured Gemella sp.]